MIFNCPNCDKKYLLSASRLGAGGKMVRCVACYYEWFQEPDRDVSSYNQPEPKEAEEEVLEEPEEVVAEESQDEWDDEDEAKSAPFAEEEDAVEDQPESADEEELDIPKGVQPIREEESNDEKHLKIKQPKVEEPLADKMMGYSAALIIFLVFIMGAFIAKKSIVSAWPPAAAIYQLAGFSTPVAGEGLLIDALSAKQQSGDGKIILQGSVLNTTKKEIIVPAMQARFKLEETEGDNSWVIEPPVRTLAAGDDFSFTSSYDTPPDDISIINLSFVSDF